MATGYTTVTPERRARVETARCLRAEGLLQREIGERMGIRRGAVSELLSDPWREKAQARRTRYSGTCQRCGDPTDGSNGLIGAPTLCKFCTADAQHERRHWTRERIVAAIRRYAAEYEQQPVSHEWLSTGGKPCVKPAWAPNTGTVLREFGTWSAAMRAAGFESRVGIKLRQKRQRTPTERTICMYHVLTYKGDGDWHDLGVYPGNREQAVNQALTEHPPVNGEMPHVVLVQAQSWVELGVAPTERVVYDLVELPKPAKS